MDSKPELKAVEPKGIISESPFYLGYHVDNSEIVNEYNKAGFLNPLLLLEHDGGLHLISGGRRLSVFLRDSAPGCFAFIYKKLKPEDIIEIFFMENRHRFINAVEMSKLINYCRNHSLNIHRYAKSRLESDFLVQQSRIILNLNASHRDYIASNPIPFNDLEMINHIEKDILFKLLDHLIHTKINGFKMRDILFNFHKAVLIKGSRIIIDGISGMRTADDICRYLYSLNNPFITKKRKVLSNLREQISKRYGIYIGYDNNFEDPVLNIKITVSRLELLEKLMEDDKFYEFAKKYLELTDEEI